MATWMKVGLGVLVAIVVLGIAWMLLNRPKEEAPAPAGGAGGSNTGNLISGLFSGAGQIGGSIASFVEGDQ